MKKETNRTYSTLTAANLNLSTVEKNVLFNVLISNAELLSKAIFEGTEMGIFRVLDSMQSKAVTILRKNNALPTDIDHFRLMKNQYDMFLYAVFEEITGAMNFIIAGYPTSITDIVFELEDMETITMKLGYQTHLAVSDVAPGTTFH